jgi:integrase
MASIGREGKRGELKRIIFRDAAGKQQSLRLGKCSQRAALNALAGFERVHEAHRVGSTIHPDGLRWLESIDDRLHARVVRLGLGVEPRKGAAVVTVAELLERFDATASVKASTRAAYKQTTDSLRAILGEGTPLASITPAHADDWRKTIAEPVRVTGDDGTATTKQLAPATVAKRVHVARAIFKRAVRWGLVTSNPFAELRAGSQSNPDRAHYVDAESIRAILEACPDDQWRAVVALSRFAGLRCPSEVAALRWGDVNWERGRLMVRSPKTAGHEGHAVRVVPMVAELRSILQDLFDNAEPGAEAVVPRLRVASMNLRTTFGKIIARAGVKPWPRLFHNMRASCATDWVERFPAHVVAGWLGHSPLIAARHYLQTRDAHFDMAAGVGEAAANPATQARPRAHNAQHATTPNREIPAALVGCGVECDPVGSTGMGDTGPELPPNPAGNTGGRPTDGSNSGNKAGGFGVPTPPAKPTDPELAAVAAAWPDLPPAVRAGIVAMVRAATPQDAPKGGSTDGK